MTRFAHSDIALGPQGSGGGTTTSGGGTTTSGGAAGTGTDAVTTIASTTAAATQVQPGLANAAAAKSADADVQTTVTRDGISVSLVREPSTQATGVINVSVPKDMATSGSGFSFPLPAQVATDADVANIRVTTLDGNSLPSWLKYLPDTKTFASSAVPDGAFPFSVLVTVGSQRTTVVISARATQ